MVLISANCGNEVEIKDLMALMTDFTPADFLLNKNLL